MKKISKFLLLSSVVFLTGCAANTPPKRNKILKVDYYGSRVFSNDLFGFIVSGGGTFKDSVYKDDDYLFYEGGPTTFTCRKNGTTVNIEGIKIANIPSNQTLNIDLRQGYEEVYLIPAEIMHVVVKGDEYSTYNTCFIVENERETPIRFDLDNVNIVGPGDCSIFANYSNQAMEISATGNCSLVEGKQHDVETLINNKDHLDRVVSIAQLALFEYMEVANVALIIHESYERDYSFEQAVKYYLESTIEFTKTLLQNFENAMTGGNGANGVNGVQTVFSVGNLCFSGSGKLNIIGGDGGKGQDTSFALVVTAQAGNGGMSAPGFISLRTMWALAGLKTTAGQPGEAGRNPMRSEKNGYPGGMGRQYIVSSMHYNY